MSLGIARALATEGAAVMLNGFGSAAEIEKLRAGLNGRYHAADMAKAAEVRRLVEHTIADLGRLDILVNNAVKAALHGMRQRGWGRIINIASAHGLVASANKAAYVATKHGLVGLTKVVALETAATGITCNAICPGWVLTPLVQKQIDDLSAREKISGDEAKRRLLAEKQPSGEFATPEQIGGLAVFLCSQAASQIRGASLSIDGGWTAQ